MMTMQLFEVKVDSAKKVFATQEAAEAFMQQYIDAGRVVSLEIYDAPVDAEGWAKFLNGRGTTLCSVQFYGEKSLSTKKTVVIYTPKENA